MKKHIRPMVPALGALVLLYTVYGAITWQRERNAKAQALSPENDSVYMTDLPELSSLSWTKDDKSLSFTREGGTWYYKGDKDCPIRQYPLTTLADTLSHLKAERKLKSADSPETYGLDNPPVRFDTVSPDGSSHTILLRSQVPGTGGADSDGPQPPAQHYAVMEGNSQIHTIDSYLTKTAAKGLYDFVEAESLPRVEGADIREITVSRNGQTSRFCKKAVDDANNITRYKDSAADESNRPDGNGALNNLADIISGLSLQPCVSCRASDEESSGYGLPDPTMVLSWTYESGDTNGGLTSLIGSLTEGGTSYYTRKDDFRVVNLISKEVAVRCLNAAYPK